MTLIRKIYRVFRLSEWWEYKIVPVLAIAYATCIQLQTSISSNISWILFLLVSIIVGAIYVSTINDITDIEDDLRCGKKNRMVKIKAKYRFIIPLLCLLVGCLFAYKMSVDLISLILYILPWVVYSLYSFKPFRLKERGFWGVLADSLGAHVFISLLIVSSLSFKNNEPIDWIWFTLVGGWSLTFGIRGILWHQFHDRENDLKSGTSTFATKRKPDKIKRIEFILLFLELSLFIGMSFKIQPMLILPILLFYFLFLLLRYKSLGYKPVIIINPRNSPLQILMIDFYLVFFPLGLLVFSGFNHGNFWILLGHLFLFNSKLRKVILDSYHILVSNKRYFMSSP